jgi:hypothetical protein
MCVADAAPPPDGGFYDASPDAPLLDPQFKILCDAVRGTMIAHLARCDGATHRQAVMLVNFDPCDVWGSAIAEGRMTFDPTNAAACATALGSLACDAGAARDLRRCSHRARSERPHWPRNGGHLVQDHLRPGVRWRGSSLL